MVILMKQLQDIESHLGYVRYEALSRFLASRVNNLKVRAKVRERPAEYSVDIGTHKLQQQQLMTVTREITNIDRDVILLRENVVTRSGRAVIRPTRMDL